MESVSFLPVEILQKMCMDVSDPKYEQTFTESKQNDKINEHVNYFETHLLPALKTSLSRLLTEVMAKDVLNKYRSALNPIEFLVLKLYINNPLKMNERKSVKRLDDIPWAAEFFTENPRRLLPLNYYLTRSESAIIIQKYWRGYMVRKREDIQDLRQWQREWRIQLQNNNHTATDLIQSVPSANALI